MSGVADSRGTRSLIAWTVGIAVLLLAWPHLGLGAEYLNLGVTVVVYATLAYSLDTVYSTVGLLPLSQGAVWGVGAYAGTLVSLHWSWTFLPALGAGAVAGALASFLIGLPSLRAKGHYYLILTFAAAEALRILGDNTFGIIGGPNGLTLVKPVQIFGLELTETTDIFYVASALLLLTIVALVLLRRSALGKKMSAIRENERLGQSLGLGSARYKLFAFACAGFFAGMAGVVYVYYASHIEPGLFGGWAGVTVALMLLLGGTRSIAGPLAGAAIVYLLPPTVGLGAGASQVFYGIALIVIILVFRQGLVPGLGSLLETRVWGPIRARLRGPSRAEPGGA